VPICFLHGLKDQIAQYQFAKQLFDRIPGNKKKMFIYPNGFHELFNDTESNTYKNDLISFFGDVLKNNPPSLGRLEQTSGPVKKIVPVIPIQKRKLNRKIILAGVLVLVYVQGLIMYLLLTAVFGSHQSIETTRSCCFCIRLSGPTSSYRS